MTTITRYCPTCGARLDEAGDFRRFWFSAFVCSANPRHEFLHIADARWIYPLLNLQTGVIEALRSADEATVKLAVSRIKFIDYKTVSIVGFEHTLLGCYDTAREQEQI